MKTCSLCSALMEDASGACPRCGIASGMSPVAARGRAARALRTVAVAATGLAVLGVLALPLVRATRGASSCEPHSWMDWHVAMEQACLTPAYVCENMTSAKLLEAPDVASELRDAFRAGQAGARAHLDALVGHMRDVYGCEGSGDPHGVWRAGPDPRLPPGHPPIPSTPGSPTFDAPATLTI